jgi:hypothetical protein
MDDLFKKAASLLEQHLTNAEFLALGIALDGDPGNQMLDAINDLLDKSNPEVFGVCDLGETP